MHRWMEEFENGSIWESWFFPITDSKTNNDIIALLWNKNISLDELIEELHLFFSFDEQCMGCNKNDVCFIVTRDKNFSLLEQKSGSVNFGMYDMVNISSTEDLEDYLWNIKEGSEIYIKVSDKDWYEIYTRKAQSIWI